MENNQDGELSLKLKNIVSPIKAFTSPSRSREKQEILRNLESILTVLIKNYSKWEAAQKRGTSLCASIESIKSKTITNSSAAETTLYPDTLQEYCEKLAIIFNICEDIVKNTEVLLKQIRNLVILEKESTQIFCKTWSLKNFEEFIEKVYNLYRNEVEIKRKITTNIAHCQNRCRILIYAKLWEYPEFADEDLKLLFIFLRQEIKDIIKID